MNINDWEKLKKEHQLFRSKQEKIFSRSGQRNPYFDISAINLGDLTLKEKNDLYYIIGKNNLIYKVNGILERFRKSTNKRISIENAHQKLSYQSVNKIPLKETGSLRELSFSIPVINHHRITPGELGWLYSRGYIPHLYWNNGKPRFHHSMWFIIDFLLRKSRKEIGFAITKTFSDFLPPYYVLRQYIDLTIFMYNSWNLGKKILDYSGKTIRKTELKGEEFRNALSSLTHDLWVNEGNILAKELVSQSPFAKFTDLLFWYRDIFALFAFEAFPGGYLIDIFDDYTQRAATFNYEQYMLVATHNFGAANINTYHLETLSGKYDLLFTATDRALSMVEEVYNRGVTDIVKNYRWNENDKKGLINCRICGVEFKPRKSDQKTCGKEACILANKNISKRKYKHLFPPIVPR